MSNKMTQKNENLLLGILLFSGTVILYPLMDAVAKCLSQEMSPLFVGWTRCLIASLMIVPFSLARFGGKILPQRNLKSHFLRTLLIVLALVLFFASLSTTPLATASAISMIAPIVTAIAAVYLLGEKFTTLKCVALFSGFLGAIIIINPTVDIEIGVIYAALSGICYGFYIALTRLTSHRGDALKTLTFQNLVGAVLLTPIVFFVWEFPTQFEIMLIVLIGLLSLVTHGLTILAFQYAQASTLSPLTYLELIIAAFLGYLLFADILTITFWVGAVFIVVGGLIVTIGSKKPRHLK